MGMKKFVMISNRGPNFTSNNVLHRGMGGTKGIYASLMENFCKAWVCLAPDDLASDKVQSDYGSNLKILFIEHDKYANYYYKYVSEYLYPSLLGYPDKAIKTHSTDDFEKISRGIVDYVYSTFGKTDVMICDYHLFRIPQLITWSCRKVFLWFIPILTKEFYPPEMKEIVWSLSRCNEVYLFNEVYVHNFKLAFRYYFPNEPLQTKVRAVMMGPDDSYLATDSISREGYTNLLTNKLGVSDLTNKKILLSASRMDFVKNIPLSIRGFEKYLRQHPEDSQLELVLIAPHHRKDSNIYIAEANKIKKLVDNSEFKSKIHLTHDYFNAEELRVLFKYSEVFVCPSTFDAVPLTPLEYILANDGNGAIILSDSIGAYMLVFPNCLDFKHNNTDSLANAIYRSMADSKSVKKERMKIMKSTVMEQTLQKSMEKIRQYLINQ